MDNRVCPICQPLEGHTWRFDTEKDPFPTELSAGGKIVWDCQTNEPRTHGNKPHNCRCTLSLDFDLKDLENKLREQRIELEKRVMELRQ